MQSIIQTEHSSLKTGYFQDLELIDQCIKDVRERLVHRPEIKVFGKICHQARDVGFFSDESIGYRYSRQMMPSQSLLPSLSSLLDIVNREFDANFNGILVNLYVDGNDSIGDHSDDETSLGKEGVIAISSGATRKFRIRDKTSRKIIKDIAMDHGMIIQMSGQFQREFTHGIPVEKRVKESRISFTFRHHKE